MNIIYDKTNESACKYQESMDDAISDICEPLSRYFGIKGFWYTKTFFDGRCFVVGNQSSLLKFIFQFILQEDVNAFPFKCLCPLHPTSSFFPFLSPVMPNAPILQGIYDHGFWGGIGFLKVCADSIELWVFFGGQESSNMRDFCLRNQEAFLKFIPFFKGQAADIMRDDEESKYKLGFYKNAYKLPCELPSCKEDVDISSFLEDLRKKSKYLQKIKPEITYLTSREQDCLSFLAKGDTAKEIARNLELSPRTIETHLKTIKYKTGFHSRSQLIKFFLTHFS